MVDAEQHPQFEVLLNYIHQSRGFDFTGYKRSSLMRRVNQRLQLLNLNDYEDYLDYLEVHPEEFQELLTTLLINVTAFFRDQSTWDYLLEDVLPKIVAHKQPGEPIRVWSAGCASGEEPYSLAMAIAELIGTEQFHERVKIYATDVDDDALNQARQATYSSKQVANVPPEWLSRYFNCTGQNYVFRKDLRRSVIFGRHDLIQDAPISRIDLLVCRNTLMYFNAEAQSKILMRFHFALRQGGFLFLGKAEMLLTHSKTFSAVDLKRRIFTSINRGPFRNQWQVTGDPPELEATRLSSQTQLREVAFDRNPIAWIVIDQQGRLSIINERARILFKLNTQDVGRPLQDLEISYRPAELRSCLDQAYTERRTIQLYDVEWQVSSTDILYLDIQICPLIDTDGNLLGGGISFNDVTRYKRLQAELEHSHQELEMAYEELQSTNEELETTNEEVQSTNEELETMNEEMQSTNEELETMNEEMQSTNEELQTVNEELQRRSEELNQTNAFLESILTSLNGGVVVVNRDLQVQIWNHRAEDIWGVRMDEALGQNFFNLDIGLPMDQLGPCLHRCLTEESANLVQITVDAINRRGKSIQCQVTCTPLINRDRQIQGVILLMEDQTSGPGPLSSPD